MNLSKVQDCLSQMAQYGEVASAEIGDDGTDVCRAAMDLLMLQIGIVYWLTNDHGRHPHTLQRDKNGEQKPPWLKEKAK